MLLLLFLCFEPPTYFFVFKNKNYCYPWCFYHKCAFNLLIWWLANWINSSVSIGSLNKNQLAEMLLTACNYYQLWSTSRHVQKCSTCQNNVARMQVKHLLNVNNSDIIWSSSIFLTLNILLRTPALVIESLFYFFWHWFITISYKL